MYANPKAIADRVELKLREALRVAGAGRLAEALGALEEILRTYDGSGAVELDAVIVDVLYNQGVVLREMQQPERALAVWSELLARFGARRDRAVFMTATRATFNRAACLRSIGRFAESMLGFEQVIARIGGSDDTDLLELLATAALNHAYVLIALDRVQEALARYDQAIRRLDGHGESALVTVSVIARANKAEALISLGRREQALALQLDIARLVEGRSEPELLEPRVTALFNAGQLLGELHRYEESIRHYEQLISRFSGRREPGVRQNVTKATYNRAVMLRKLGRNDAAIAGFSEVVKHVGVSADPVQVECVEKALTSWAALLERLGRSAEVREVEALVGALNREVETRNRDGQVLSALRHQARRSPPEQGSELFDAMLEQARTGDRTDDEMFADTLIDKGVSLAQMKRYDEAIEQWTHALGVIGDRVDLRAGKRIAAALYSIGVAQLNSQRWESAAQSFAALIARFPGHNPMSIQGYLLQAQHALAALNKQRLSPRPVMSSLKTAPLSPSPPYSGPPAHYISAELQLEPPVVQLEYAACDATKNAERATGTALVLSLLKRIAQDHGSRHAAPEIMLCFPHSPDGPRISDPETGAQVVRLSYGTPPSPDTVMPDANYDLFVEALARFGLSVDHALACTHFACTADVLGYENTILGFYPGRAALTHWVPRAGGT